MSHPHGTYLGGVRTIECLRERCRIDDDTGCWLWSLSHCEGHPRVWLTDSDGRKFKATGTVAAYFLSTGRKPPAGKNGYRTCCRNSCVNPDHVKVGTRAEHGAHVAQMGVWKGKMNRIVANTKNSRERERTKLSLEKAREIRGSTLTERELSAIYGVPPSAIGSARRGESWREALHGSSVFNWSGS